jgi:hypothetical protein
MTDGYPSLCRDPRDRCAEVAWKARALQTKQTGNGRCPPRPGGSQRRGYEWS